MNSDEKAQLFTLRWMLANKWRVPGYQDDAIAITTSLIDGKRKIEPEPERPIHGGSPNGEGLIEIPFASQFKARQTAGQYRKGYPEGAVVHFTAGRHWSLEAQMEAQRASAFTYLVVARDGSIGQNFPLNRWGYHAGTSDVRDIGIERADRYLVGIELINAGTVNKQGKPWFSGATFKIDEIRKIEHQTANQSSGRYVKFSEEQEEALLFLLSWLHLNNPEIFRVANIRGHDEVSPGRKVDPGGSLSLTMQDLRSKLQQRIEG
jgi:hypothetical protein